MGALFALTTPHSVVISNNMKARLLLRRREGISDAAFVEAVVWEVPTPVPGSRHRFKYRLVLVVNGECVLRYDNERGKGDHRHIDGREEAVEFSTPEALFEAFEADMRRMLR